MPPRLGGEKRAVGDLRKWAVIAVGLPFGLIILVAAYQFGFTTRGFLNLPIMCVVAICGIVDIREKRIPDWLTLPGVAWVLLTSAFLGWPRIADALLGILICGGLLLILAGLSRGAIGGGDVKLVAMVGAALGWRWGFGVLAFTHVAAAGVATCLLLSRRKRWKDTLPIGPFLAAFALFALWSKPM